MVFFCPGTGLVRKLFSQHILFLSKARLGENEKDYISSHVERSLDFLHESLSGRS